MASRATPCSGTDGFRRSRRHIGSTGPICWAVASISHRETINTHRTRSARRSSRYSMRCRCPGCTGLGVLGGLIGLLLAAAHPERVASLVLCNTPSRIPDQIRRIYALDHADAGAAMLAHGTGAWCRQTLGYWLDLEHRTLRCRTGSCKRSIEHPPRSRRRCTVASKISTLLTSYLELTPRSCC